MNMGKIKIFYREKPIRRHETIQKALDHDQFCKLTWTVGIYFKKKNSNLLQSLVGIATAKYNQIKSYHEVLSYI